MFEAALLVVIILGVIAAVVAATTRGGASGTAAPRREGLCARSDRFVCGAAAAGPDWSFPAPAPARAPAPKEDTGVVTDIETDGTGVVASAGADAAPGLLEYSSAGGPGDVGVDVGPLNLEDPEAPKDDPYIDARDSLTEDYYGPEGPTVYTTEFRRPYTPDHDVLTN